MLIRAQQHDTGLRLDFQMMGKLLSGMVQSGCWCCFDEFNFINVEVLSVIAAQLQAIQAAKQRHRLRLVCYLVLQGSVCDCANCTLH